MIEKYAKNSNYLHISLTDKCNLRCVYCKYEDELSNIKHEYNNLGFEDYKFLIKSMAELGVDKVRFTGGEPLLYDKIIELIRFTKEECGIENIGIITNATKLYEMAYALKDAGLKSVNISLDSLKEYKYKSVTGGGMLKNVLKSIELSIKLGFDVKINCVVIDAFNDDEIYDFMLMTNYYPIDIRFRELTPIGKAMKIYKIGYFNIQKVIDEIDELVLIDTKEREQAKYYKYRGAKGRIGIIKPCTSSYCNNYNKITVNTNGKMKLSLYSNEELDLKYYLQKPMIFRETIKEVIFNNNI